MLIPRKESVERAEVQKGATLSESATARDDGRGLRVVVQELRNRPVK